MKLIYLSFIMLLTVMMHDAVSQVKPGDKAKSFRLKNVDGKMLGLSDFKDAKGFIIIFSCNHCPYVKAYEARIEALNKKYASKGYPVIAINSNDSVAYPEDSFENMVRNSRQKGFTFPYLLDDTQEIAIAYGALKTPHVYVVTKSGNDLIVKYVGAIDDNTESADKVSKKYVEDAVDALLVGKDPEVKETKAIGCGVKYRK